ncbi:MAG: YebC/PmpR family DNA-binding transcriptional regulator [Bradymonadaceae bacterium]
MTKADRAEQSEASQIEKKMESLRRAIAYAAREQGTDPDENLWLRCAIDRAEREQLKDEAIERAIRRGAGETDDPPLELATFEGYGPEDVAVFVRSITESPKRTREELDELFREFGGNVGEDGCVAWQFDSRGVVRVRSSSVDDVDTFELQIIEAGGQDLGEPLFGDEDDRASVYRVFTDPSDVLQVAEALDDAGYEVHDVSWEQEPTQHVELDRDEARQFHSFKRTLTERPDVQDVFANWKRA